MEQWSEEQQQGHAMLVGVCDDIEMQEDLTGEQEDQTFLAYWWKQLHRCLVIADSLDADLAGTPLGGPIQWPELDVNHEPLPSMPPNEETIEHAANQYDEEQVKMQEEAQQEWEEHQDQLRARAAQQWDDWALASEMGAPSKRLRIQVVLSSPNSSSSSHITVPQPRMGTPLQLSLTFSMEDSDTCASNPPSLPTTTVTEEHSTSPQRAGAADRDEQDYGKPNEGLSTSSTTTTMQGLAEEMEEHSFM